MPDQVTVEARDDGAFDVQVHEASSVTRHRVTVPDGLAAGLGHADVDPVRLVRSSFEFLLEREPATSIMASFALDVIPRYFPEYRDDMTARLEQPS